MAHGPRLQRFPDLLRIVVSESGKNDWRCQVELADGDVVAVPTECLFHYESFQGEVLKRTGRPFVFDFDDAQSRASQWEMRVAELLCHSE